MRMEPVTTARLLSLRTNLVEIEKSNALQEQVTDIQYTIVKNFYGYNVGEVTVIFAEDVVPRLWKRQPSLCLTVVPQILTLVR